MDEEDEDVYLIPIYLDATSAANIAEVYMQQAERVEFIRAIASGTPASEAYLGIRYRKKP